MVKLLEKDKLQLAALFTLLNYPVFSDLRKKEGIKIQCDDGSFDYQGDGWILRNELQNFNNPFSVNDVEAVDMLEDVDPFIKKVLSLTAHTTTRAINKALGAHVGDEGLLPAEARYKHKLNKQISDLFDTPFIEHRHKGRQNKKKDANLLPYLEFLHGSWRKRTARSAYRVKRDEETWVGIYLHLETLLQHGSALFQTYYSINLIRRQQLPLLADFSKLFLKYFPGKLNDPYAEGEVLAKAFGSLFHLFLVSRYEAEGVLQIVSSVHRDREADEKYPVLFFDSFIFIKEAGRISVLLDLMARLKHLEFIKNGGSSGPKKLGRFVPVMNKGVGTKPKEKSAAGEI